MDDGTGVRWTNLPNIHNYCDYWENIYNNDCTNIPVIQEKIDKDTSIFEFFMMGLRKLSGVCKEDFERIFKINIPNHIIKTFNSCHRFAYVR